MQGRGCLLSRRVAHAAAARAITVRETPRGFLVVSGAEVAPETARRRFLRRDLAQAGAGLAGALGLWGALGLVLPGAELRLLLVAATAALGATAWACLRPRGSYEVELDAVRERLCLRHVAADGTARRRVEIAFAEVRDIVIRRPRRLGRARTLCLRLEGSGAPVEIVSGSEPVLNAVHDRIDRALAPARRGALRPELCPVAASRIARIFPALRPDEVAA